MDLQANKTDGIVLPVTNTRISADEWNQLVGSLMEFITQAGLTPDASDNEQLLNAFKAIAASLELVGANTNLSNLTATGEGKFDAKADKDFSNATKPYVMETWHSGTEWYRLWSDGWCEQGGQSSSSQVVFQKAMSDTNYTLTFGSYRNGASTSGDFRYVTAFSETGFTKSIDSDETFWWEAKGYIAQN